MPPHPLTYFEIIDYFKDEPKFNGVYPRKNLPKLENFINLDHSKNIETHWVVISAKKDEVNYFDSFGVEHISEEIKKAIENKNIKSNIFRFQDYNSVMCGHFCILFIECMLQGKTLTDFTDLFSPYDLKKKKMK